MKMLKIAEGEATEGRQSDLLSCVRIDGAKETLEESPSLNGRTSNLFRQNINRTAVRVEHFQMCLNKFQRVLKCKQHMLTPPKR